LPEAYVNGSAKRISFGGGTYFAGKKYCKRCEVYYM